MTVTLESDVVDYLQKCVAADKGLTINTLVNDLLRYGISIESKTKSRPFRIRSFKTSRVTGVTAQKIEELLDEI